MEFRSKNMKKNKKFKRNICIKKIINVKIKLNIQGVIHFIKIRKIKKKDKKK